MSACYPTDAGSQQEFGWCRCHVWCRRNDDALDLGDSLCFVFRHFPLTNIHPHSEHAAEAAEAAGAQGKFWEMHELLFENQQALADEDLVQYAAALGLDEKRLIDQVIAGAF